MSTKGGYMADRENNTPNELPDIEQQNAANVNSAGDSENSPRTSTSNQQKWTRVLVLNAVLLLVIGIGTLLLAIRMRSRDVTDCLQYQAKEFELCQHTAS